MTTSPSSKVQCYRFTQEERVYSELDVDACKADPTLLPKAHEQGGVTWINVDGVHDTDLIRAVGKYYDLHHLVIEDILNPRQRAKFEEYEETGFIVTPMVYLPKGVVVSEQLNVIFSAGLVLTFQEHETWGELFDPIRKRIMEGSGRTRKRQADYLVYTILDAIVDNNLMIVEMLEQEAEQKEEQLMIKPHSNILEEIYLLRMKITDFRQKSRPTRELVKQMMEWEHVLLDSRTRIYLRDVHDHALRISDSIESLREMLSSMIDLYSTQINTRMSEIMKVLTLITVTFVPLNLIAAIYGMNFKNMPELNVKWMYFAVLAGMGGIAGGMLYFFKKRGWF